MAASGYHARVAHHLKEGTPCQVQGQRRISPIPRRAWKENGFGLSAYETDRQLLILFIPCLLFYIIFRYGPVRLNHCLQGLQRIHRHPESDWVGLKHFEKFFNSPDFWLLFKNIASRRIQSDFRVSFSHHSGDSLKRGQSEMVQKVGANTQLSAFIPVGRHYQR